MNEGREIAKNEMKKLGKIKILKSQIDVSEELLKSYQELTDKYSNALVKIPIKNSTILVNRYIDGMNFKQLQKTYNMSRSGIISLLEKSLTMLLENI